jgi:hypothetical protein
LRTTNPNGIIVRVPAAIYSAYETAYKTSGFAKINFENFQKFGASTQVSGLTYYWNVLNETDKTAYIDYIEGTLPSILTFPDEIGGYKIVLIKTDAIKVLSGVNKIVLPDNMEYLTFNTADLPDSVNAIEIAETNAKFKTANGVLYSNDGKILYMYPKAKLATGFTLGTEVSEIAYRAFYGSKNLETLTIAGTVTIRDQAFENTRISIIKFTNTAASIFAGENIFLDANVSLRIHVPSASLDAYKANVLIDYSVIDKFVGA